MKNPYVRLERCAEAERLALLYLKDNAKESNKNGLKRWKTIDDLSEEPPNKKNKVQKVRQALFLF